MKITKKNKTEANDLFSLCLKNGRLDEGRVRNVVKCLTETAERQGPAVLQHFLRLVKLDCARQSAAPLSADVQQAVLAALTRQYGEGLTISAALNPALIGGLRIQVGCDVYDGSVKARLEALEKSF
jgi:F-type H+-transporting ATPase subunit delta